MIAIPDVWTDPELADLARSDPRLVAIADALAQVAGAGRQPKHRSTRRRAAYAAAACVAILLAAMLPAVALSRTVRDFFGLISNPPVAQNWVQAMLTRSIPLDARAGTIVRITWTLSAPDQRGHNQPFDGQGIFARLVNPTDTAANTAFAHGHAGRYAATVRVPQGGIGSIQVGIRGWSSGPTGKHPAPVLFPITNDPLRDRP